ncbi:MAG: DUF6033 family protein [Bacteroides sp.]|nr:DUF6033 family protein [Bacteroides sp.]MCM1549069.1 DUF6033 family protein [Clostridium sp.]
MDVTSAGVISAGWQHGNQAQKAAAEGTGFIDSLQSAAETELSRLDAYQKHLEERFGTIMVQNVGRDQRSMDTLGYGTFGAGNVVIAPNILKEMANDPQKAAYYEQRIQEHFDNIPQTRAFLAAMGHRMISSGVVIHPDGTVTYYLCGEESPETKARVEAENKAKEEKKAKRRRENQLRSLEAARKQKQELTAFLTGTAETAGADAWLSLSDTAASVRKDYKAYAN